MDVTEVNNVKARPIDEAITQLAAMMKAQPAFTAFMQAYQDLQADEEAQRLLKEGRQLGGQLQLRWTEEKQARFNEVLDQYNDLPCVQAYSRAELAMRELFCAVDTVISESAGVDFAVNARRSSCCG